MKILGIVGRMYYNKDNQEIIQMNDYLRRVLCRYDDIVTILLLPTNNNSYINMGMGNDNLERLDKEKLEYVLNKCDGFIVPGGTYWYCFDEYVIEYAIRTNKSILGICAGFQAMCSMFAKDRNKFDMTGVLEGNMHYGKYDEYVHEIVVKDNSLLSRILNENRFLVNSLHHYGVDFPMNNLVVSAISLDNMVEAIELNNHKFFLGIQWHPEYLDDENSKKIFEAFIDSIKDNNI